MDERSQEAPRIVPQAEQVLGSEVVVVDFEILDVCLDFARSDEAVQLHEGRSADVAVIESAVKVEGFAELRSFEHSLVAYVIETVIAAEIVEIVADCILVFHVAE